MDNSIIIIVITLIFSAFFSGIEIAFYSANKLRLELKRKQGDFSAGILSFFIKRPTHFMTNTLVGNNIALVIYSIFMKEVIDTLLERSQWELLQSGFANFITITLISSIVVLVFAEFLPKALFRVDPDRVLSILIYPFKFFYYLFWPINKFIVWISQGILRVFFRVKAEDSTPVFNHYDLFHLVTETNEEETNEIDLDTQIFKNAIEFPNVKVRECMIPRPEITAVEIDSPIDDLRKIFNETGHSKVIVYKENIDNVLGYTHIIELFRNPTNLKEILMPISISTESMLASELLKKLIEVHRSIAVVVDEFGGTSGIITIEDIIEEIFGEIRDEHDLEDLSEIKINEDEFIFSARLEIDYLNEKFNLNFPEGDYETLGGLILNIHESIPESGEVIRMDPYEFKILNVSGSKINEVRVRIVYSNDEDRED